MAHVDYSGTMAEVYDRGRQLPTSTTQLWIEAALRHLPGGEEPLLDLGAGTGRFLRPLAQGLCAGVIGLEPAEGMRAQAAGQMGGGTCLVAGTASELPFASLSFRCVWASQVLHHVTDLDSCARELGRVLRPGGRLLVRGMYDDLEAQWPLVRYFPGVLSVAERFTSFAEMRVAFSDAGLCEVAHEHIEQTIAEDPEAYYARTALRADSGLALLPDDEFRYGLDLMRIDVENGALAGAISETLDLVVFERR